MKSITVTRVMFGEGEQLTLREFIECIDVAPLESNITVTLSSNSIVFSITHKEN